MCCKNGSCNDNACDQLWTMCWITTYEEGCGDLAHWLLLRCMCVPRVMVIYIHLDLLWKQLGRISVTKFFGHDNVGNRLEVEYQHRSAWNHASIDQKWEFSVYKQGFMNFMLMTVVLSDPESCLEWVFVMHILLVNLYERAYEYVFNESSNISDGRIDT
jgi:hypothetical protein